MHAPLVGRERELDLLLALHERVVAEGRPHLVTIYGEPGVGKSRLVTELVSRVEHRTLIGRCLSYGDGIAYWPLAEILKSLADIADDDPVDTAIARVASVVEELLGEPRPLDVAALAFTLGLEADSDEFARLQPSAIRVELHRVWRALLSSLAAREPLVVVIDDIHWADPVLLDLLEETAERAQGPILLLCPARPELTGTRPSWGGGQRSFSAVFLGPLSGESASELVSHLLNVDGLGAETRSRILARAEGNPFFLEEILRRLIDEGGIVRDGDRWRATADLPKLELPDTVQAVLAARIDLLEPSAKRTLQQASVVGRVFWKSAVEALVDNAVDPDLRRLEERELVAARFTSSMAGEDELAFSHILTRDVAYETLPRRDRPRAHARVASWIEETTGDRQREYAGLLAYHYAEAYRGALRDRAYPPDELEALRQRAFDLTLQGAQNATRGAAFAAARSLARSAVELGGTAEERAGAYLALGVASRHASFGDESWDAFTGGADVLVEAGSTDSHLLALLCGLACESVCRWTGTMSDIPPEETVARYLEIGLGAAGEGDSEARVHLTTAEAFWGHPFFESDAPARDGERGVEAGTAASEMAIRLGRTDLAVLALDAVQFNLQRLLRYGEAHATAVQRLEMAQNAGDLNELADAYAVAAWNAAYLGLFEEAAAVGREGYERLIGDAPYYAVHSLSWHAYAAFFLGEWNAVVGGVQTIGGLLDQGGNALISGLASPWPAAAFVHEARGDRAASERLLADIDALEEQRGRPSQNLAAELIRTLVLRGDLEAARGRLDHLAELREGLANLSLMLAAEAELFVAEERWAELPTFAALLRKTAGSTGTRFLEPVADRLDGLSALAAGNVEEALGRLEGAVRGFDAYRMAVDAAVARLDLAEALVAAGRSADARTAAEAAVETFERVGYLKARERAWELIGRVAVS
jgi:hypothetical protein